MIVITLIDNLYSFDYCHNPVMPRIDFTYNVTEGWRINGADNVIFDGIDSSIDCINFIQVDLSTLHRVPTSSSSTTSTSTSTNENLTNNNNRSQYIYLLVY